ncbi:MAG: hypothetical protein KJ737_07380 [Proteobacteria bacterium]|nr:hypothetical protein [Pseudomonadota bacterium]
MKKGLICLAIILLAMPSVLMAETFKSKKDVSGFIASLSTEIVQGKIKEVFDKIKPYWPIPEQEIDVIVYQLENQRNQIISRFGKRLSIERAETFEIGDSFYREVYLVKYEKHAVAWVFTFYKPMEQWIVNSVRTSDQMDDFFQKKK